MSAIEVSYGRRLDPSLRCSVCGKPWLVPQAVRWSDQELLKSAEKARADGWLIREWNAHRCPAHQEGV